MKRDLVDGAVAGVVATVWMSGLMLLVRKFGNSPTLPPRKIVEAAVHSATDRTIQPSVIKATSVLAHFGFGATAGALFGALQTRIRTDPLLPGVAFGLLVWATSYKGWIPALGILPKPEHDNPSRARLMFVSHIVYGAALGEGMRRRTA